MRDLDAHSWVEAWFPGYGWVTRDPTPAAAPPRNAARRRRRRRRGGPSRGAPDLGGERLSDLESGRALAQDQGTQLAPARPRRRARGRADRRPAGRAPAAQAPAAARAAAAGRVRARAAPRPLPGRPGHDADAGSSAISPAGPARWATCARCASSATRAARPRRPPSSAAGCGRRSPATRASCAPGGRCRRGGPKRLIVTAAVAPRGSAAPCTLARDARHGHTQRTSPGYLAPASSPLPPRAWARTARRRPTTVPLGPWVAARTSGAEWDQKESHHDPSILAPGRRPAGDAAARDRPVPAPPRRRGRAALRGARGIQGGRGSTSS